MKPNTETICDTIRHDLSPRLLIPKALKLGATSAAHVETAAIRNKQELALLCKDCPNYGTSAGCPPHSPGPKAFEALKATHPQGLVVKIEVPMEILLSHQRKEVYLLLHQIMDALAQLARTQGVPRVQAFAGGGCKSLFCADRPQCRVLSGRGECPHPSLPSMSGCGVDVAHLLHLAGWQARDAALPDAKADMGFACGLLVMGG